MYDEQRDTHRKNHRYKAQTIERTKYKAETARYFGEHSKPERQRASHAQRVGEILCHLVEGYPFGYAVTHE